MFPMQSPPPVKPRSLREMIRTVGNLGGFLGGKSDGEARTRTLWRGLQRANDIAIMFRGVRQAYTLPPRARTAAAALGANRETVGIWQMSILFATPEGRGTLGGWKPLGSRSLVGHVIDNA